MSIGERIEEIKPYFVTFNVHDGLAYVLVKFPKSWSLFSTADIEKEFDIKIAQKSEGVYFFCEVANGFDDVFDAINYIITNNKSLEEKKYLLQEKVKELSELFLTEPLEKLKTMKFTFDESIEDIETLEDDITDGEEPLQPGADDILAGAKIELPKRKNRGRKPEVKEELIINQTKQEEATVDMPSDATNNNKVEEEVKEQPSKKNKKNSVKDSSLMNFAKGLIDGE